MGYQLNLAQAISLLRRQGLNPRAAAIGAAVMMPESGGSSTSVGDSGQSKGPWQVYRPAHPDVNQGRLQRDPNYAAQITASISNRGRDWSPWTGYKTGAYRKWLPTAMRIASRGGGAAPPRAGGVPGARAPGVRSFRTTTQTNTQFDQEGFDAARKRLVVAQLLAKHGRQNSPLFTTGVLSLTPPDPAAFMSQSQTTTRQPVFGPQGGAARAATGGGGGGGLRGAYRFPLRSFGSQGRTDRGQDMEAARAYEKTLALGNGVIVHAGTGFPGVVLKLDRPYAGHRLVFYGHTSKAYVRPGQRVRAGQVVGQTGGGPGGGPTHTEIGFTNSPDAIPSPQGPGHWAPTGQAFHNLLAKLYPNRIRR